MNSFIDYIQFYCSHAELLWQEFLMIFVSYFLGSLVKYIYYFPENVFKNTEQNI